MIIVKIYVMLLVFILVLLNILTSRVRKFSSAPFTTDRFFEDSSTEISNKSFFVPRILVTAHWNVNKLLLNW